MRFIGGDVRGAGRFETAAISVRIGRDNGEVKTQGMRCGVVRNAGPRIGVEFEHDATGLVGEETSERRLIETKNEFKTEVGDIPVSVGASVGDVQGEVFEFHESKVELMGWRVDGESTAAPAAVDGQDLPGDVVGSGGSQKHHRARQIEGLAPAVGGNSAKNFL